jgi:hypothetical protein
MGGPAEPLTPGPASVAQAWCVRLVLVGGLALAAVRLGVLADHIAAHSLQMDFSAFYTAGEALRRGLSPYVNNYRAGVWDGVDAYVHSRFLYPPLVATFLKPLALLPYALAKRWWIAASLAALAWALWTAARICGLGRRPAALAALGLIAAAFHPLLTLLERGQIDTVTLALVVQAAAWLAEGPAAGRRGRARAWGAGGLLALATLLKLNIGLVGLLLPVRRRWRAALGFAAGGVLLLLASLAADGPATVADYLHHELPRIARFGEGGPDRLPAAALRPLLAGVPPGDTRKDGRIYSLADFGFVANATLVRPLQERLHVANPTRLSLLLGGVYVALAAAAEACSVLGARRARSPAPGLPPPLAEFAYWNMAFVAVLLTGPLTWVMNVVWLLPTAAVLLGAYGTLARPAQAVPFALCALGLAWAALPDPLAFPLLLAPGTHWRPLQDPWKYVVAEGAVLVGLAGLRWPGWRLPTAADVPILGRVQGPSSGE